MKGGRLASGVAAAAADAGRAGHRFLVDVIGSPERVRLVAALACVLGLSRRTRRPSARRRPAAHGLGITNTDIGLLVAVTALVAAVATMPFGVLADRVRRTWTLGAAIALWSVAMFWSAVVRTSTSCSVARLFLGVVTAAAGPLVASLVGDYFPAAERGRIYGYILAGELLGAGFGFAVTGDIAALSWRAAFVVLALPAFVLAWFVVRLPEPRARRRASGVGATTAQTRRPGRRRAAARARVGNRAGPGARARPRPEEDRACSPPRSYMLRDPDEPRS